MSSEQKNPTDSHKGLTALALKNQVTMLVLVVLLSITGIANYFSLPKQQDPGFTIRTAVVTTKFPGANPTRVEQLVTDRIEEIIQEIPELDNVTSESRTGISIVNANFKEKYKNMRPIFNKLRRKIDDLKVDGTLPNEITGPNVDDEFGDVFGILYMLNGEGFSSAELKDIADDIRDQLLKIEDVAKVDIHGAQEEVIYVEYNGARLNEMGLTPQALSSALQSANILQAGGDVRIGQERIILEPTGNFETVEALKKTVIQIPNTNGVTYLGDIASVKRGYKDPPETIVRFNGIDGLLLAISLREGGDILALGKLLDATVPKIESEYPYGISIKKVFSQPDFVENAINGFMSNLVQAIAIVTAVMFAFLGLRTGLIVASLIPVTIVLTLVCMDLFGITINQISLAALIIALGLLVDNAIVMAESIMVRRQNGEDKVSAAIAAGNEMRTPLLISSLTTAAAFLAIFLAESAVGEYTADIFKVVAIALISSWLMGMTFIPLMTLFFMRLKQNDPIQRDKETYNNLMYRIYNAILIPSLRFKLAPLLVITMLFITAIWALKFVPSVFIPERTDPLVNAKFNMPRGTDIATTESIMHDLEQYMLNRHTITKEQIDGITGILSFVGVGPPRYVLAINPEQPSSHTGAMVISTGDHLAIPDIIADVKSYAVKTYPDLEVQMKKLENGTPIDYPIEVRVYGKDIDRLYELIKPIKQKMLDISGVMDVNDDWGIRSKKLVIHVDQDRARRAGVTNEDVALSLKTGLSGLEMTQFREDDKIIPVILRSVAADRHDLTKFDGIIIYAKGSNASVPLKQVADIQLEWQNAIIKRRDRSKKITVRAQLYPGVTATEVSNQLLPWLQEQTQAWPPGYHFEMGGEMEESGDANQAIADKLPLSGMVILLLLVAQFNSIRKTAIILITIPLGMIGVTFGLLVANSIFGFFTILGIISLSGIIINNAIVLIDRINIELENGKEQARAIVDACQQRLRPILLTTATTAGGMLPLWISHDPMFETMAVTIIFGLLFATILTLIIVPVLYAILFKVRFE